MAEGYKDLIIWRKSFDLSLKVYHATSTFPSGELYGLTSQMRRCAISIPSNIAEGAGRGSDKEFSHFLKIALRSTFELETQMLLSERLKMVEGEKLSNIYLKINELEKMIIGFLNKLSKENAASLKSNV